MGLALVAALALAVAARPAAALELGVSDSNANTVVESHWDALSIRRARIVVPYDVAMPGLGDAGLRRRAAFEAYRVNAVAKGVALFVVFGPSADIRAPGTGDAVAPSGDEFSAAFAAFRAAYPDVTTISPWNEPNNPDARQYPLASSPELAAEYYLRAQAICGSCTLVAGEFAGIGGDDAYVDAYLAALGGAQPAVWGIHAHGDVNAFQANGPDSARVTRWYLGKLQGQFAGGRVWIDEVGARFRDASGTVWGDASQAQATQFLLGLAALDSRIDGIYYYNYSNECTTPRLCAVQDRGLVSPAPYDGQPLDYDALDRRRPAFDVMANRGPAIVPAQLVPPVVSITQPAASQALPTATPAFAGQAATGGRAATTVTLRIFPGAAATQGTRAVRTVTARVVGGAWTATVARLPDGVYTAEAAQAGNPTASGISEDVVFAVDTVAPTTVVSGPPPLTGARTATLTVTASEPGVSLLCSVDRAKAVPCTSPLRLRDLAIGRHRLGVRAVDAAGNVQRATTRFDWRVVSLATALAPRLGGLDAALSGGLPLAATCADACTVGARLYLPADQARALGIAGRGVSRRDPARPRGRGWVTIASGSARRTRAGAATLALRVRASSSAAVRRARTVTARVGIALRPTGSKPTEVSEPVTLVRAGALRTIAARGLPATIACSSGCTQRAALWAPQTVARALRAPGPGVAGSRRTGLPRGRYVSLGAATATRRGGGTSSVTLPVPRAVSARVPRLGGGAAVRVATLASGPGTAPLAVSLPLALPR